MTDLLQLLDTLTRRGPTGLKLIAQIQRARKGDQDALSYLLSEGWSEGLDLWKPGAGEIGRQVVQQAREAIQTITGTLQGDVIDGEGQEVFPWDPFLRRLMRQANSAHIILGPTGSGKTTL